MEDKYYLIINNTVKEFTELSVLLEYVRVLSVYENIDFKIIRGREI